MHKMHRVTGSYGSLYFTPDVIVRRGHRLAHLFGKRAFHLPVKVYHLRDVLAIWVQRSAKLNPAYSNAGPELRGLHVSRKTYVPIPRPVDLA